MSTSANFDATQIVLMSFSVLAVITLLAKNTSFKLGKFEIKRKNELDEQIDKIDDIVKKQNETTTSNLSSILSVFSDVVKQTFLVSLGTTTPPKLNESNGPHESNESFERLNESISKLAEQLKNEKKSNNTWSLVEGLINSYHKQALRQASIQFWFSIIAAVVGFGFVINEIASNASASEKAIGAIPGLVIDLVAALFFRQAEQTRQRATELYDRLRTDNERTVAIGLIDSIDDNNLKSVIKAQLALKIGGVESSITELSTLTIDMK